MREPSATLFTAWIVNEKLKVSAAAAASPAEMAKAGEYGPAKSPDVGSFASRSILLPLTSTISLSGEPGEASVQPYCPTTEPSA